MKKLFFLALIIILAVSLEALKNWKVYTNTSYITSLKKINNQYLTASWGGVQSYKINPDSNAYDFPQFITTMNGLSENFIKDIEYDGKILYLATNSHGVDRYENGKFILPINNIIGLISDKVNKVVLKDSLIFISTKSGLSIFSNNQQSDFPILIKNFNTENGLSEDNIINMALYKNFLYCGSGSGIDYISVDSLTSANNVWHHINSSNSPLPDDYINSISANDNFIAFATKKGICVLNNPTQPLGWKIYKSNNSIYPIFCFDESIIYSYGYWDEEHLKIVKPTEDTSTFSVINNPFETVSPLGYDIENISDNIMGFSKDGDKFIIYTWDKGFYVSSDLQEWEHFMPNCPIANSIFRLKFDKNNKLWLSTGHHKWAPSSTGTKGISSFDGTNWENYSCYSSPLISNNIISIDVDEYNHVFFGTRYSPGNNYMNWSNGVSIFYQDCETWDTLQVGSNFIMDMYFDEDKGEKWFTCYDGGVVILNNCNQEIYNFEIYGSTDQKVVKTLPAMDKVFFGFWFDGIKYWNDTGYPDYNEESKWVTPAAKELNTGKIYDIAYRESKYGEKQVWFASGNGLFMFNGENWYWYGPIQKKRILASSYNWEPDEIDQQEYHTPEFWYVVGQKRLYGSVITYPTALFVDPFGSIWIGTHDNGITRFYPDDDLYINYSMKNSPLLSNTINDFAYNADTGELYIATSQGLNSVYIGISPDKNKVEKLHKTIAYPNPFSPYKGQTLKIENKSETSMPKGNTFCKIFDLSGNLIIKLTKNDYQSFEWNGKNNADKYCAPGIYFYLVYTPDGQIDKNKFVIKR